MKKLITSFLLLLGTLNAYAQADSLNMVKLGQWDLSGQFFNDIWGFTDGQGNEYAIIGSRPNIYFFDVTNPSSPTLVEEFSNGNPAGLQMYPSTWRDFKVYGNYCYAVADQFNTDEGLLIFDLSNLPNAVTLSNQITTHFDRAHNIFIDNNNGKLYVAGSDSENDGLIVLDLAANPTNPPLLGTPYFGSDPGYVHDLYAKNDIVYACHGYNGFYIWDLSNVSNPVALSSSSISGGYVHSVWLTNNGDWAFVAEELPKGQPLAVVDVSNLNNISTAHTFKFPLLAPAHVNNTPHNPFVKDTLLYVSYYEDGVQVFDISNPLNPIQTAYYDTEPNNTTYNGTSNNWGVYPYLPSGTIIASDLEHGLFTLELNFNLLPLELNDFSAQRQGNNSLLTWETAQEKDVSHFEIQKSSDGLSFSTIHKTPSQGNSQRAQYYQYIDKEPFSGTNYYRLKMVDLDGTFDFSKIQTIYFDNSRISIAPTLLRQQSTVSVKLPLTNSEIIIRVYSLSGQLIYENIIPSSDKNHLEVPVNQLPSGAYIFCVKTNDQLFSKKIIKH